jgi:uncharacterized damage-inducible protein DinB
MTALDQLRRLWDHAAWADEKLSTAIRTISNPVPEALREFTHVLATEEVWLSRMESRSARVPIWPTLDFAGLEALRADVRDGYAAYLTQLTDEDLDRRASYVNSAGQPFETPIGEILLHVALHGQYHRGKVNLLLRQSGEEPAPTDFIAFVRGVPAARS